MRGISRAPFWLVILALAACGGEPTAPAPVVTVTPATARTLVGESFNLQATVRDAAGNELTGRTVTWTSNNTAVATVVATGPMSALVRGVGPGTATITATAEGQRDSAAITVVPPALAFATFRDGNLEIYVMDATGTDFLNLTNNPAKDEFPAWSPDGSKIAFTTDRDGNFEVYVMNADGTGLVNLTNNPGIDLYPAWSPNGSEIAFHTGRDGNAEVYVMNADGTGLVNLTNNPAEDAWPTWSPDGSRIAFSTTRDGNYEVYVMNADGTGLVNLTHNLAYDALPSWRP